MAFRHLLPMYSVTLRPTLSENSAMIKGVVFQEFSLSHWDKFIPICSKQLSISVTMIDIAWIRN